MMLGQGLWAQEKADDPLLAKNDWAEIRKSDFETAISRYPDKMKKRLVSDQKTIIKILSLLLRDKTLAAQARAEKLDQEPKAKAWLAQENNKLYARLQVDKIEKEAGEAWAKKEAEYAARAPEIYLANKKKYEIPEQVKASHILIALDKHSKEDGLKLAQEIKAKIAAGEDFGKAAEQYSEDKGSAGKNGALGWFASEQMVPEFSKAAFALKKAGDVSEPVLSKFGWHLILLEDKKEASVRPFEEVKKDIMEEQKQKFVQDIVNKELAEVEGGPTTVLNEKEIDALYVVPPSQEEINELVKKTMSGKKEKSEKE
ncbi:MAG: peptidylprolyl isomerase [Burkholderiales bacterium]|nr:peptidylprolyl isomerase [Burkholderiales bacterium]